MLANMPATSSIGNMSNILPSMEHGQCLQFNYLKRKLEAEDTQQQQQHQQQQQPINNANGSSNAVYQAASNANAADSSNAWKKRISEAEAAAAAADATINEFITSSNKNSNNNNIHTHNQNNNNVLSTHNSNSNDLQFNLISSAFINDLFSYDNSLIVPVTSNASHTVDLNNTTTTAATAAAAAAATFGEPSSGNIAPQFVAAVDDGNWQATDLLELDHRYNSALQTIEHVSATTAAQLSPTIEQLQPTIQQHFLVPQKQVSRSQYVLTKYRQHYQQQPQQPQQQQHYALPQPQQQQQQQQTSSSSDSESDFEDKNLSWLLNFKFDELPHLSPDIGNGAAAQHAAEATDVADSSRALKNSANSPASASSVSSTERSRSKSPKTSTKASKKFEELVMEVTAECDGNEMIVGENVVVEDYSPKTLKKPPFTYTELIEYALEDKGELTVSGIYQWISDRFPYYKSNDDRWKNSVRHNLSINPHFRKGAKAPQGAGHLWTISSGDSAENVLAWEHKKQRLDLFFKMESMNRERIQEHQQKMQKQQQHQQLLSNQQQQQCSVHSPLHQQCQPGQCLYDEAAAAAAAITQEMLQQTATSSPSPNTSSSGSMREQRHGFHDLHGFNDLMSDEELRKTAGQILNGIHREVEVQSVNSIISTYHDMLLDSDYLNPIHKDVAVNESGLRNTCHNHTSQYYITEIDPLELGIQMSHQVEEEVLFNDEFNLNYFGYNVGNDIVA